MSVRDTIRSATPTVVEFTLKEGKTIWVRAFSGPGRMEYSGYMEKAKANGGVRSEVVAAMAICEQDGSLAYDWHKDSDLEELVAHIDAHDLDRIGLRLFDISGLTDKANQEAEKN